MLTANNGLIVLALMEAKNMSVTFVVIKTMCLNILQQHVLNDFLASLTIFISICVSF